MFTRFSVQNYRNITADDVPLKRVNLLIGPNNCGKSNFLRALGFLQQFTVSDVRVAVENQGGAALRSRSGSPGAPVVWRWVIGSSTPPFRRCELSVDLALAVPAQDLLVNGLRVQRESMRLLQADWDEGANGEHYQELLGELSPFIGQTLIGDRTDAEGGGILPMTLPNLVSLSDSVPRVSSLLWSAIEYFKRSDFDEGRRRDELLHFYQSIDVAGSRTSMFQTLMLRVLTEISIRDFRLWRQPDLGGGIMGEPAALRSQEPHLAPDGRNIANVLRHIDQTAPDGLTPLHEAMRELVPDFKRVVIREGGDYRWIELQIGADRVSLREVSDGTRNALVLATLLYNEKPAQILCVDEPELNLHPSWLRVVARWFQRAPSLRQSFLSTHSPDLLDSFTDGFRSGDVGVLVFNARGEVRAAEPAQLDAFFQQGWALGDLYRVGEPQLGGWP